MPTNTVNDKSQPADQWWGYSTQHGWLVQDLNDPINQGKSPARVYLRCKDWVLLTMPHGFGPPPATSFTNYLLTLKTPAEQEKAKEELSVYQSQYPEIHKHQADMRNAPRPREEVTAEDVAAVCAQYNIESLYHLTHVENLESILRQGLLCRNRAETHQPLSSQSAHRPRPNKSIPCCRGLTIHHCVPLFFAVKPPMLSSVRKMQQDVLYLHINPTVLTLPQASFTDGNTAGNATRFFKQLDSLRELDWPVLTAANWKTVESPESAEEIKRRRSAEVLIPDCVPLSFLTAVSTRTEELAAKVKTILAQAGVDVPVHVNPDLY